MIAGVGSGRRAEKQAALLRSMGVGNLRRICDTQRDLIERGWSVVAVLFGASTVLLWWCIDFSGVIFREGAAGTMGNAADAVFGSSNLSGSCKRQWATWRNLVRLQGNTL